MPIHEPDPWRQQYFRGAVCPDDVHIPTDDPDCWLWFPEQRWVYDKIEFALSQGLEAGPHGVPPPRFPVFSKPITNLKGMGVGSRVLNSKAEYDKHATAGHMWMSLLQGRHVSSDVAIAAGEPRWWRHVTGKTGREGTFDYWTVHAEPDADIEDYCGAWIRRHLKGYTGFVNIETIGGRMIELHLRFSDQWPDLYGDGWVAALVGLYNRGRWDFADRSRRDGYSVVLFGPHGPHYRHPPPTLVQQVEAMPGVSSVQITFHEGKDPAQHAMPPGGFRLAIVNAWSLQAGLDGRELLAQHFLARAA